MEPQPTRSWALISLSVSDDAHLDTIGALLLAAIALALLAAYIRAQRNLREMAARVARLETTARF